MGISSEMSFVYILFLELYDFHQSLHMRGHELRKRAAPVNREEMDRPNASPEGGKPDITI